MFCNVKGALLKCKRAPFAGQKGVFYNPIHNLLIVLKLQTRKGTLSFDFRIYIYVSFVKVILSTTILSLDYTYVRSHPVQKEGN